MSRSPAVGLSAARSRASRLSALAFGAGLLAASLGAGPLVGLAPALAGTPVTAAPTTSAAPDTAEGAVPLPEIPKLEPLAHGAPTPAASKELEGRLGELEQLRASSPVDPKLDLRFLTADVGPDLVPAIAQRVQELRGRLDGPGAEALLEKARKAGRKALDKADRGKKRADGADGADGGARRPSDAGEGDWLAFVVALGRTEDADWRDVLELYGMLRMLEAIGTTPAVRLMVDCYSYFGELVRIDVQRAIARLGDRSVAALLEARKHDTPKVARWAGRLLDELGRAIPGQAVSSSDPEILADVLRAYGRTRDVDATRVILSFCGSDRVGLRQAAREAIGAIGEPAAWQLKDAYQQLTGEKPPRGWAWDRIARELFRLHDKARLAEVYRLVADGSTALTDQRFADAASAFDQVLARQPLYERRAELAPAYVGLAEQLLAQGKRDDAVAALRKALRLRPEHPDNAKVESRIAYLEGLALVEAGTPDRFILRRALELDSGNEQARKLLASLDETTVKRQSRLQRYVAAALVGLAALLAMVWLVRRPRRPSARTRPPSGGGVEPRASTAVEAPGPSDAARPTEASGRADGPPSPPEDATANARAQEPPSTDG
jgi:tetratricopeptide (TPR) repeat protein